MMQLILVHQNDTEITGFMIVDARQKKYIKQWLLAKIQMQQDDSLLLLRFPLFGWFWKMLSLYIYGCADSESVNC